MQTRSRFSRILVLISALIAAIAANTFRDPAALEAKRRRTLEELRSPAPWRRPVVLTDRAFRPGLRAYLKSGRRDYFVGLHQLGGTPATRTERGVSPVMNRAARRAAARALRYVPS